MRTTIPACAYVFISLLLISINYQSYAQLQSQKKDTTIIRRDSDNNEADEQIIRLTYFEKMHKAAGDIDWRAIESQNSWLSYQQNHFNHISNGNYANGSLQGYWMERGSTNQAGRLDAAEYDSSTNRLYVLNDRGVLYQGVPDSANWHPLNDQLRFTRYGMKLVPNGTSQRLIITSELNTYYTDDNGANFHQSSGFVFPVVWGGNNVEQIAGVNDANQTLYCLAIEWDDVLWQPLYYLYRSTNKGAKWSLLHKFSEGNEYEVVLWSPPGQKFLYALENVDGGATNMYKIQGATVTLINTAPALSSTDEPVQFAGALQGNKTKLYALTGDGSVYKSSDLGKNWVFVNTVPDGQGGNLIGVSLKDSNKIIIGGIPNCF
jgi:hypothetical protein